MKIDVHNHCYPARYLKQPEKDEWDRQIIVQHGTRVVTITPPMNYIGQRMEDMERAGGDMQILSLTVPSINIFPVEIGEKLAKVGNDEIAQMCQDHPNHFMAFATLPFKDPKRAFRELERCIDQLNFQGACISSNINGMGFFPNKGQIWSRSISQPSFLC
jgi:predicted TIM-barrel fold metal-dependent hydrolase